MAISKAIVQEFLAESNAIEGVYDMDSLAQAQAAWDYLITQKKLTTKVILKTHKLLMKNHNLKKSEKGNFRTVPVWIGGHQAIDFNDIRTYLEALLGDINAKLTDWKEAHIIYEKIHPFVDGNGRTGRMFMNWQRINAGLPILVIHEGKEQIDYYRWFK